MREIEFRGKLLSNGKWVYGFLAPDSTIGGVLVIVSPDAHEFYEIIPETISEYTGLRDKNGVKIFEGDIFTVNGKHPKIIKYLEDCACFGFANTAALELEEYMDIWQQADKAWWNRVKEKIEVIGNIHDNPELLEEKPE